MKEDARYLRNQSRAVHRLQRRNMRLLRWTVVLWLLAAAAFTSAALIDVMSNLHWGYEPKDIWIGLLMIAFGGAFWVFATIMGEIVLSISRRLYGPEPAGPPEG